jgi:hypothetical protein
MIGVAVWEGKTEKKKIRKKKNKPPRSINHRVNCCSSVLGCVCVVFCARSRVRVDGEDGRREPSGGGRRWVRKWKIMAGLGSILITADRRLINVCVCTYIYYFIDAKENLIIWLPRSVFPIYYDVCDGSASFNVVVRNDKYTIVLRTAYERRRIWISSPRQLYTYYCSTEFTAVYNEYIVARSCVRGRMIACVYV